MKKFLILGGLLVALFLLFIFWGPMPVLAAAGDCHLEHCLVPAPTVYLPKAQAVLTGDVLAVVGLTWKRTVVEVYVDGRRLPVVEQFNHEDYYAGFYARAYNLQPGQHFLYTIARSEKPGWFDQSQESTYIYFTVPAVALTPQPRISPEFSAESKKIEAEPALPSGLNQVDDPATGTSAGLDVLEGNLEGGVYVEAGSDRDNLSAGQDLPQLQVGQGAGNQENNFTAQLQPTRPQDELSEVLENEFAASQVQATARRNRLIGLAVLFLLAIGFLIGRWVSKNSIKKQFLIHGEDQLPPAPTPPLAPSASNDLAGHERPIVIEPIKDEESEPPIEVIAQEEPKDYWGEAGPTPYTPRPLGATEENDDRPGSGHLT